MEFIKYTSQFEKMIDNKIIGMPELINAEINFRGKNNILFCDNNIKLENVILDFNGNNSIVYLSSDLVNNFKVEIYNNSFLFLGKDIKLGSSIKISVHECQNVFIGDDCIIGDNAYISTSNSFPIYDGNTKERINYSKSVFIGDHVFLGNSSYISRGVYIGSGAIVGDCAFIPSYSKIPSNSLLSGNPAVIIRENVFFTDEFLGPYLNEDSLNSKDYRSDVFIYRLVHKETLDLNYIDDILKDLNVEEKLEFIQKLFVRNKRRNRFAIEV